MPQFYYRAISQEGSAIEGNLFASSTTEAVATLAKKGWTATRLRTASAMFERWGGSSLAQQVAWYMMFSDLLSSGMALPKSLELLAEQSTSGPLAEATRDLRSRVLQGESLSQAMRNHPKHFQSLEIALVSAGEEGAFLDTAMERIADVKKSASIMRSKLMSASAYPLFLLLVGTLVLVGMLLFFVPRFEPLFERMRELGTLPWATQALFATTNFVGSYWYIIAGLIAILAFFGFRFVALESSQSKRDYVLLNLYGVGSWVRGIVLSRYCHLLGTLLSSGVKIQKAILIAGQGCGNACFENASMEIVERVTAGSKLAEAMERQREFPKDVVEIVRVGEQTNRLEKVLLSTSLRLDARNQQTLEIGLKLIEPMLMAFMASIIGFLMIALLMPIFNASGTTFQ